MVVERVLLPDRDMAIEGRFEPPALARLSAEDQVFVMAFVQVHGSIKEMERAFGVSYPTVKNRLNRIAEQLPLVEVESGPAGDDVLERLERGEIDVDEAIERMGR